MVMGHLPLRSVLEPALLLGALYFLALSLSNVLYLRVATRRPARRWRGTDGPRVSVLIPARDEERSLGRCLASLLDQTYANYEIVVLDDESSDGTWEVISRAVAAHPGLVRGVRGSPLADEDWYGKPHAMQQLAACATGDVLMFTDADTVHGRDSVAWAVANMQAHHAHCLSGYVGQELASFGEQLVVPATYIMTAMILPLWLIPRTRSPALSFAIGQLLVFDRRAFEAVGGLAAVATRISEDTAIAREMKARGFRTVFLDASRWVQCRMYRSYRSSLEGIAKNIYDYLRNRTAFFATAMTLLVAFAVAPALLLPVALVSGSPDPLPTLLTVVTFLLAWALALYDRGLRWWVPFLYPLLFLQLLAIAWMSFTRVLGGDGVAWKGRVVR
jgi:chlorobactene glucosyltransferase